MRWTWADRPYSPAAHGLAAGGTVRLALPAGMAGQATGDAAEIFEAERRRLFGLAYRLLGSAADAEDAGKR